MKLKEIHSRLPIIVFDYRLKRVFLAKEGYRLPDCLPGSIREREIFQENYIKRGFYKATFRQYKCFDAAFHGVSKKKKKYGTIELTQRQYERLLEINPDDMSDALNKLIQLSYIGEKRQDMNITAQRLTRKALIEIMETITEKMRDLLE